MKKIDFFEQYRSRCEKCNNGERVLIPKPDEKNGFVGAKIMFINERPGRVGPGETGFVSFDNSDPSARRFKELFSLINIPRKDIFITNTCLWYPDDPNYTDTPPNIVSSVPILQDQIQTIKPLLIVAVGGTALKALKMIFKESKQLRNHRLSDVGKVINDTNPIIYPVYHTSNRAGITRSFEEQKKDWRMMAKFL